LLTEKVLKLKTLINQQPRTEQPHVFSLWGGAQCLGLRGQFPGSLEVVRLQGLLSFEAKAIGPGDENHQRNKIGATARAGARFSEACLAHGALGQFVAFDQ
jgi:hypothetical protein